MHRCACGNIFVIVVFAMGVWGNTIYCRLLVVIGYLKVYFFEYFLIQRFHIVVFLTPTLSVLTNLITPMPRDMLS